MERAHDTPVLYLHLGAHRTGTTTVQNFFFQNRKALQNAGIMFFGPKNELTRKALDDANVLNVIERRSKRSGNKHYIISFENYLCTTRGISGPNLYLDKVSKLTRLFRGSDAQVDCRILFTLRAYPDFIVSLYKKEASARVKRGTLPPTWDDFRENRALNLSSVSWIPFFHAIPHALRERMTVLDFDYLRAGDVIDTFCSHVGIGSTAGLQKDPARKNASVSEDFLAQARDFLEGQGESEAEGTMTREELKEFMRQNPPRTETDQFFEPAAIARSNDKYRRDIDAIAELGFRVVAATPA